VEGYNVRNRREKRVNLARCPQGVFFEQSMIAWQIIVVALIVGAAAAYLGREIWRMLAARPGCGSCGSCKSDAQKSPEKALVSLEERRANP
jgi:hypothetical protein